MKKVDNYFDFLSEILSEETKENQGINYEVDKVYNELFAAIDSKLMPEIETISNAEKYSVVDDVKKILSEYKLILYFPELVCKHFVTFYKFNNAEIMLKKYFGLKKGSFWSNNKLPEGTPCVFIANDSDQYKIQNFSENVINLDADDYELINELNKKKIPLSNMIALLSIPLKNELDNLVFASIPDVTSSVYIDSLKSYTDTLVINAAELNLEITKEFPHIKRVIVIGGYISNKKIAEELSKIGVESAFVSEKKAAEYIAECNYPVDNTLLSMRLEERIYCVIEYVSRKLVSYERERALLNDDIMTGSDKKTLDIIKEFRSNLASCIDESERKYNTLKNICARICEIAEQLEMTVRDTRQDCDYNHFDMVEICSELFLRYLPALSFDRSVTNRVKNLGDIIKSLNVHYTMVVNLLEKNAKGVKVGKNKVLDCIMENTEDCYFLVRAKMELDYKTKCNSRSLAKKFYALNRKPSFSIEDFYYGIALLDDGNEVEGLKFLNSALEDGITEAGEVIMEHYGNCPPNDIMATLVNCCVPEACFNYGKDRISTNESSGLAYIKIAASLKYTEALVYVANYYFGQFGDTDDIDKINECLGYYNALMESCDVDKLSDKSIIYLGIGLLNTRKGDYETAKSALFKSGEGEAYLLIGLFYEEGMGFAIDLEEALKHYLTAKKLGCSEAAAAYDRVASKIAEEKKKKAAAESASYSSYTYYSGYYSSYYSDSGCVLAGTNIILADGSQIRVENIKSDMSVLNCSGTVSSTSDELIVNDSVRMLYSINDDEPFMSFEHAILTNRGWCSLNPGLSNEINPNFNVKKLLIGDVIEKADIYNGRVVYTSCEVKKINITENSEQKLCYDLHFYDGYNSYYANGYPCLLNYPTFTLSLLKKRISDMRPEEAKKFLEMCGNYSGTLETIFGKTNIEMLFMNLNKNVM